MKPLYDQGGPAFPMPERMIDDLLQQAGAEAFRRISQMVPGMSVRDYFAAAAMQGYLANPNTRYLVNDLSVGIKSISEAAYKVADAMLAERNK